MRRPSVDSEASGAAGGDRAIVRRVLGRTLLLLRRAIEEVRGAESAAVIASVIARTTVLVQGTWAPSRCLNDPLCEAMLRRAAGRVADLHRLADPASDEAARLLSLQSDLHALGGEPEAALGVMAAAAHRINLVQGYALRDQLLLRFLDLARALGQPDEAAAACLRDLAGRRQLRTLDAAWAARLPALAAMRDRLPGPALRRAAGALGPVAWIASMRPRRLSILLASVYLHRVARPRMRRVLAMHVRSGAPVAIRAMGGAGDLLMMTPGLRALARRGGRPVELVVPRRFAPLFDANPDVVVRPVEELDDAWRPPSDLIDLTDCPTVAGELLELPDIRTNRIELFAAGMGVTAPELDRHGRRPFFEPSAAMAGAARDWMTANGLLGRDFIAIQARPAETYRAWPRIAEAAAALAQDRPVVVFHDRDLPGFDAPGVRCAFGLALGTSLAIACRAALIVAPDSAFVHLAGARSIPCIGVFGPTGGAVRLSSYAEARVVAQTGRFACMPCWRNEFTPCRVTQGMRSLCLDSLDPALVVRAARGLIASSQTPPRLR